MMGITRIEWTATVHQDGHISPGYSFNPWLGCQRVAVGCEKCYAEAFAKRTGMTKWGPNGTRVKTSESYWRKPLKWNRDAEAAEVRRRVFSASLADVFEDWTGDIHDHRGQRLWTPRHGSGFIAETPQGDFAGCRPATLDDVRADLFKLIDATPNLDWLLLTKRPENIRSMWPHFVRCRKCGVDSSHRLMKYCGDGSDKDNEHRWESAPRPNVWLGTSIANQDDADRNIPLLLACRDLAPVLFVSAEPLIGPVDLCHVQHDGTVEIDALNGTHGVHRPHGGKSASLDWCIVGCESGHKRRPMQTEWAESLARQCADAEVAFFMKQLEVNGKVTGDMELFPEQLRVREFATVEESQ